MRTCSRVKLSWSTLLPMSNTWFTYARICVNTKVIAQSRFTYGGRGVQPLLLRLWPSKQQNCHNPLHVLRSMSRSIS